MEQNKKEYRFRAITKNKAIVIFSLIIPVFFTVYLLMDNFVFYKIKNYNVFTNIKAVGIPIIITFGLIFILSNYLLSKKYLIKLNNNEILLTIETRVNNEITISNSNIIQYNANLKYKGGSLKFYDNNNEILIISGFLFTRKRDFIILNNCFNNIIYHSLMKNNFSDNVKKHNQSITYILTKKD